MNNIRSLKLICIILLIRSQTASQVEKLVTGTYRIGEEFSATEHDAWPKAQRHDPPSDYFEERCLRRFSPGTCAEPVQPVYTYSYHQHNCTQRLGCVVSSRTNRFKTYTICARVCQAYMDLWTTVNVNDVRSKDGNGNRRSQTFHMAKERSQKEKTYLDLIEYEERKRQHEVSLTRSQYEPSDLHDSVFGDIPLQEFDSYL